MKSFVIISMEFLKAKKAVPFLSTQFGLDCTLSQMATCKRSHTMQNHHSNLGLIFGVCLEHILKSNRQNVPAPPMSEWEIKA